MYVQYVYLEATYIDQLLLLKVPGWVSFCWAGIPMRRDGSD